MNTKFFIPRDYEITKVNKHIEKWRSPSNIALVKYWGKRDVQIPANPSISFTLKNSYTETEIKFTLKSEKSEFVDFDLYFEGEKNKSFDEKVISYFKNVSVYTPYLKYYHLEIKSSNSFPHSSGIASSASAFSALSVCIVAFEKIINMSLTDDIAKKKESFLSRLGSGSACRSVNGPLMMWGEHKDYKLSTNELAIEPEFKLHDNFKEFQDTILLIDKGQKSVSSTIGHGLMNTNPYAKERFVQANKNMSEMKIILEKGDLKRFGQVVENEALSLHAMMMTSTPSFILMKPNTVAALEVVKEYRDREGVDLYFTLDAGANIHLLYPKSEKEEVLSFIKAKLVAYCENEQYICDELGNGATSV